MEAVNYHPRYKGQILALLNDVPFKSAIWEWQFEQHVGAHGFDPVVITDNERVIAFNGVMPAVAKYGDGTIPAIWSCDFYVDEKYRGQGVGRLVKETLMTRSPVIMSFGVSPKAAMVLEHMGWKKSKEARGYRRLRGIRSPRDCLLQLLQLWNRVTRGIGTSPAVAGTIQWSDRLPEAAEVDGLWKVVSEGYKNIVGRDHAYLAWKYERHPLATYRFLVARSPAGELEGILIVRRGPDCLRVVDWLGPAKTYSLKRAAVRACRLEYPGVRLMTATTTDPEFGAAFCAEGFFKARTKPSFYVRSSIEGDSDCEKGWFIMSGDSDGELLMAASDSQRANAGN